MDKNLLFEQLLQKVLLMMENSERERQKAQTEANYHIGAMQSRYDTFKEEAQYLAGAQLKQLVELGEARISILRVLQTPTLLQPSMAVRVGAIVTVEDSIGQTRTYLITPALGGEKLLTEAGVEIVTLTLQSPLGAALAGKRVDDEATATLQGKDTSFFITHIE